METRGNYILIGLFTILGILGMLAFFLAFAQRERDRQFAYYTIRFESVSGLAEASDVRFAGLPVGQVVAVSLSPELDGLIQVQIEVDAMTPVRVDSVASVETLGVTGVGFVAISGGNPGSALAMAAPGEMGTIQSGRSVIQSLSEDAPALVQETLQLVRDVGDLFSADNRDRLDQIIINAESASASFAQTLEDFSEVSGSVEDFVTQIDRFNSVLQTIAADFDTVLITADQTVGAWGDVAEDAEAFLNAGETSFDTATGALVAAEGFIDAELVAVTQDLRDTIEALRGEIAALGTDARGMVGTFNDAGQLASDRLQEISTTITALDQLIANTNVAIGTVETAALDFSYLITEDGQLLADETRAVIATTQDVMDLVLVEAQENLPAILDNVSVAAEGIVGAAEALQGQMTSATSGLDDVIENANSALITAQSAFGTADEVLRQVSGAIETGEGTLTAATGAFQAAEGAIQTDLGAFITRLSSTLDGIDLAVGQVAGDLPAISASLRDASEAAEAAFEQIERTVATASPAVQEFAAGALPEYAAFAQDARSLANSLDRLIRQIERDPGRFFLGSDTPEFRR